MPKTLFESQDGILFRNESDAVLHEKALKRTDGYGTRYKEFIERIEGSKLLLAHSATEVKTLIVLLPANEEQRQKKLYTRPYIATGRVIDILFNWANQGYHQYGGGVVYETSVAQCTDWEERVKQTQGGRY